MSGTDSSPVLREAAAFAARAAANGFTGYREDVAEWRQLNADLGGIIPEWYVTVMTTLPLAGLELGRQSYEPEPGDDGLFWLDWMDIDGTRGEMLEAHPGIPLLQAGYLCVAGCSHGTGNQYFIPTTEGDDPPFYNVYHDVGEEAEEILANGRELIAPSLSELFRTSLPRPKPSYL